MKSDSSSVVVSEGDGVGDGMTVSVSSIVGVLEVFTIWVGSSVSLFRGRTCWVFFKLEQPKDMMSKQVTIKYLWFCLSKFFQVIDS